MTGIEIGPILGALAASAAGSIASYAIQSSAASSARQKQNAEILRQAQMTSDTLRKNADNTEDNVQKQYDPENRLNKLDQVGAQQGAALSDAVKSVETRDTGGDYGGKVTKDYLVGAGNQKVADLRYARNAAALLGRARAPGVLMQGEGVNNAETAIQNATRTSDLRGDIGTSNVKIGNIHPSGGMMLAGDLIGGLSSAYAGAKLGGKSPAGSGAVGKGFFNGRALRYTPADAASLYTPKFVPQP